MITAFTAASLSKLLTTVPPEDRESEAELEYEKQYVFAQIRFDAIKGRTDAITYYNEALVPILRAEGFKVEKYKKVDNRMVISWDHVIAS